MHEMKFDMSGGAAVLEAIGGDRRAGAAGPLRRRGRGDGEPASGSAVQPGDIVRAKAGITIEVNNTDAEGRLVLADCLTHAREQGAERLIDLATLTGGVVSAFGNVHAGLMGNDDAWCDAVRAAGEATRRARLAAAARPARTPSSIKGRYGDLHQRVEGRTAQPITAARSSSRRFAGDVPWAHLDIAGVADGLGRPYAGKGAPGWGVRLLVELVADARARSRCARCRAVGGAVRRLRRDARRRRRPAARLRRRRAAPPARRAVDRSRRHGLGLADEYADARLAGVAVGAGSRPTASSSPGAAWSSRRDRLPAARARRRTRSAAATLRRALARGGAALAFVLGAGARAAASCPIRGRRGPRCSSGSRRRPLAAATAVCPPRWPARAARRRRRCGAAGARAPRSCATRSACAALLALLPWLDPWLLVPAAPVAVAARALDGAPAAARSGRLRRAEVVSSPRSSSTSRSTSRVYGGFTPLRRGRTGP